MFFKKLEKSFEKPIDKSVGKWYTVQAVRESARHRIDH